MEFVIKTIIEILGKPKEHVEATIKKVSEELRKKEGITIINEELAETKEVDSLFATYIDLELNLADMDKFIDFCFDFLPSSIEILEPEKLELESEKFAGFMNDLLAKLHQHSMIIRNLHAENLVMKEKLENKP